MKTKIYWTTIIFLLIAALSACSLAPAPGPAALTPAPLSTQPSAGETNPEPAATETSALPTPAAPQASPSAPAATAAPLAGPSAKVNTDQLNLRMGPGTTYQVLKVMPKGLELTILGRSTNGTWLEASLPDGTGGWVYANYVDLPVPIAGLPITEAAGGPLATAQSGELPPAPVVPAPVFTVAPGQTLAVTILDNQASLQVVAFPANQNLVVSLARDDGSGEITVANGQTGANGSANITFDMPATWSDGEPLVENSLTLIVTTANGAFSRSATIQYYPAP